MRVTSTFLLFFLCLLLPAQELIVIETQNSQLVYQVSHRKNLKLEYFGKSLPSTEDLFNAKANHDMDAYPVFGLYPDQPSALRVTHPDGNMSLVLKYQSHETKELNKDVSLTTIHLKDEVYPFYVDLNVKTFKKEDVLEMWTEIWHTEKKPVVLNEFYSGYLTFRAREYWLTQFHGFWADEFMVQEEQLIRGTKLIENKQGNRTSQSDNPSFFLTLNGKPSEDQGEVIAGTLAWTGNYKISFSQDWTSRLHITAGIHDEASDYKLPKEERFNTPALILTYTDKGKGQASRNLHRYARNHRLIDGNKERKILLNSWEGVYFTFNEEKLVGLIDDIASIGGELFVLDDGWFGNKYPRNSGKDGLGDWQVCKAKLPRGLNYLIDEAEKRGIKFGIWVEPEMVNITSELYEKHPEWVIQQPNRELVKGRGGTQVVLDLSNPEVQDFIYNTIHNLMVENPRIDYIKWDANKNITNYGSTYLSKDKQSHLYVDYHRGLENVLKRIRQAHPSVTMQACASGGGRTSYGYLPYFHEFWTSDNTDALKRVYIQWGTSHIFPAVAMASHVSASPNHQTGRQIPIKFRFDVAMSGRLGMEIQPKNMTQKELTFSKEAIKVYKDIRPIIQFGDLYRLISPFKNQRLASLMYVNEQKSRAIFFAYYLEKRTLEIHPPFKMNGLDPKGKYRVKEINLEGEKEHLKGNDKVYSGEFLMNVGLRLDLKREYDSVILEIIKE